MATEDRPTERVSFGHDDIRDVPYDTVIQDEKTGLQTPVLIMSGYRFVEVLGQGYRFMAVSDRMNNPNG